MQKKANEESGIAGHSSISISPSGEAELIRTIHSLQKISFDAIYWNDLPWATPTAQTLRRGLGIVQRIKYSTCLRELDYGNICGEQKSAVRKKICRVLSWPAIQATRWWKLYWITSWSRRISQQNEAWKYTCSVQPGTLRAPYSLCSNTTLEKVVRMPSTNNVLLRCEIGKKRTTAPLMKSWIIRRKYFSNSSTNVQSLRTQGTFLPNDFFKMQSWKQRISLKLAKYHSALHSKNSSRKMPTQKFVWAA